MELLNIKTVFSICLFAVAFDTDLYGQTKDQASIRAVLQKQVSDWNKGNLNEFMSGYWRSDSLEFIGKSGVKYGYQVTLDNYKKNYPDTAAMGKLSFDRIRLKPLSSTYYYVTGSWALKRTIGDISGYFSLLFKKINNRWLIISDHSS